MEIVQSPRVFIAAKSMIDPHGLAAFRKEFDIAHLSSDENPGGLSSAEYLSELSGRICYWSYDKPRPGGNAGYLDRIKESGHGSVIEHPVFSLIITGVSRTLTHELVRHRAGWAYSQLSQRYYDESECRFVRPLDIEMGTDEYLAWCSACAVAQQTYRSLVTHLYEKWIAAGAVHGTELRKRARGAARSVLPGCTETRLVATANVRAIRHFLEMRGSKFAEGEIRRLANVILDMLREDSPTMFDDYETHELPDGTREITTKFRKV